MKTDQNRDIGQQTPFTPQNLEMFRAISRLQCDLPQGMTERFMQRMEQTQIATKKTYHKPHIRLLRWGIAVSIAAAIVLICLPFFRNEETKNEIPETHLAQSVTKPVTTTKESVKKEETTVKSESAARTSHIRKEKSKITQATSHNEKVFNNITSSISNDKEDIHEQAEEYTPHERKLIEYAKLSTETNQKFNTFLNNYRQNEEIRLRQAIIREATTDYIDEMNI